MQAPTSAHAPHASSPSVSVDEAQIRMLLELGPFSRSQAVEALQVCEGNAELAAQYLLQRM
jgi:hypothetical protein